MIHDPLCPPEWQTWDAQTGPCPYCNVIALVRVDERRAAANRVSDAILFLNYTSADRMAAIKAARGET